jgi:hypothetical protein
LQYIFHVNNMGCSVFELYVVNNRPLKHWLESCRMRLRLHKDLRYDEDKVPIAVNNLW